MSLILAGSMQFRMELTVEFNARKKNKKIKYLKIVRSIQRGVPLKIMWNHPV